MRRGLPSKKAAAATPGCCDQIVRGYFGLGDHETVVHVTSTEDFLVYIWARNVETFHGGVQITTPPSQFRGTGSTGPMDGLVLDVPPQTAADLGCVGGKGTEKIDITNAFGARVSVFLTVVTCQGARVSMTSRTVGTRLQPAAIRETRRIR
jgi:hypothetical protein